MIEITIAATGEKVHRVDVRGHGGGEVGYDIVCAAVSAITETALTGLLHHNPQAITWKMGEGFMSIQIMDDSTTVVSAIVTTMILGLKQIEREYPGRVSLHLIDNAGIADET